MLNTCYFSFLLCVSYRSSPGFFRPHCKGSSGLNIRGLNTPSGPMLIGLVLHRPCLIEIPVRGAQHWCSPGTHPSSLSRHYTTLYSLLFFRYAFGRVAWIERDCPVKAQGPAVLLAPMVFSSAGTNIAWTLESDAGSRDLSQPHAPDLEEGNSIETAKFMGLSGHGTTGRSINRPGKHHQKRRRRKRGLGTPSQRPRKPGASLTEDIEGQAVP